MSEERIITAAVVTTGEKSDGPELPRLLEISQRNGLEVDTIIGDATYSGKGNPSVGKRTEGMFVCPAGHLAIRKARQGKKNRGKNQADTYYFDVEKCKVCPLREGCYKPCSKTKTYSITIKSELHKDQIAFQESDYFLTKSKERYKIETKNSELKNVHGYGRANSYGVQNMEMQGAMAIFTVHLKRILKLI